jgi:hypothetical protein
LLSAADERPFQVFGTEKKTPSSFDAGYNCELSPQADKDRATAITRPRVRTLLIPRFCLRKLRGAR